MSIQQSTELIIFVTHVEAEDSFLKIWGQVDKNSATCVERMILPLVEQFARSQGCVESRAANLHVNALCCARFQNEGYYRAKVINIRPDGMVVLQFIDYGNIEVLPPQEIHLLENIPGSESLQSFPPVAFDFTLMYVLPVNGIWESKIIELIKKTLWYNEYKILIHTVINNHRFIKLWYSNEDFSELLIKRHMAVAATLQEMFRPPKCMQEPQIPMYQQSGKHLISNNCTSMTHVPNINPLHCDENNMHGYQRNVPLCCAAQQKHMMQSSVQEALVFKSRVLDVPSKHEVYVSFVEDGPHKFSVQLQSTSQILSMLMRDINSHSTEPLQEPPLPGSVCLGRYTQDKVLCRAVVMSVMENKCKLYYVDFGHTEVLPYTDIFQLPPHFINPKVLSIRFTLSGVKELDVTDEMKEYFKQIVSGKLLVLHVCPPEGPPLVQYGDLYDDGQSIKNILRQAFPTPMTPITFGYQEPTKLLKGAEEIIHVSFVESCRKFFVQLDSNSASLESIMDCLAEFCKNAPSLSLSQLKIGLPCAALYDNQWYRAQVLGVNMDNVKVLYVDYGNEETVTIMSLRLMHDDLIRRLGAQAIKCILNGWEHLPCTQEVSNQFESLILEKRLLLRVTDVKSDGLVVDLYEPERKQSIKSQMLHTVEDDTKLINTPTYQNIENQHTAKISPKNNQSENMNTWQEKDQIDSWNEPRNTNTVQERYKSKSWKDESNEEKISENRSERSNFHRNDSRNERFSRDDFSNTRSAKDKWNNKNEYNDSLRSERGRGGRGGRNKTSGYGSKNNSSDQNWSDKGSDTSSKGSTSRRGRGSASRGGHSKGDGFSGKMQSSRFSDRDSDGSVKGGKTNSDSYYGNNKFRDRKGQGYRLTQNKINSVNSSNFEEGRRYSPMRSRHEFHIPSPDIVIGSTKACEVVYTNSPSDFFVQLSPDYTALDSIMESIASIYENGGELVKESKIFKGLYCIAQYSEDLRWYRAIVKSVEGNNATVQFLDYGNTETIDFSNIKVIRKEFLKLPVQAVHCKLFGMKNVTLDTNETKTFGDKVNGKTFKAEFITEENGIYSVLLREIVDDCPTNTFINEEFCDGLDLLQAKEAAMSQNQISTNTKQLKELDYASLDAVWSIATHTPGTKKDVIVTWFTNPNNFYCQALDNENEFKTMMNKIQRTYTGREPVSYGLKVGSPVIASFFEDKALYRAEIIELNKLSGHLIHYVDFGNSAVVDPSNIYPVEKEFIRLPKQAFQCSLLNISPKDGLSWSKVDTGAIDNCFNADKYECTFHDIKDNKYLILLSNNGSYVADVLIERNLASCDSATKSDITEDSNTTATETPYNVERVDINLLSGQKLRVKVSSVETVSKFYVQLPSATECDNMVNTYMADKDPKVMQRLSAHEICLGTGCLVYSNGVWRRAVIGNHSRSTGFDVKFIDTGAYDEILSDCVLALPGQLAIMQNQAVECSLINAISSSEVDVKLKNCVEGKEVIMYVDEVDNNRLIVKLFDLSGNKINIFEETDEKISPICPMPVLSSTHKALVSYADHSASIWLQRNADYILDKNLSETLNQYYSASGKIIEPEVDLLCAAKSADGNWYRAKVLNYTETEVCVHFIDYGNNEEVTRDVVMALDLRFYVPHQLAINVSLPITLTCTISEQLNILQDCLSNKELTAVFRNVNKKWIVELLHDGEKISEKLHALNLASEQEVSATKQPDIHNMEVGCIYDVYIPHIDSPSQFWLQYVSDATNLSKKQEELQIQISTFPQVDGVLEEGSLCVAVHTIDNLWYRAQVLDADEDITTVRFIDYGNTDIIDNKSENIRGITDSWKEIKEFAIKCRLDVIPVDSEDWNATTCETFENLITSVEFLQAKVIANSIPKRVDLLIDGTSVTEMLVKQNLGIHTEEDLINEIVDLELDPRSAFVSHINSPNEFWVQEEKSVGDLEVMTDRFIVADMFPKVDEITENMLCVAKYPEDDCWYRARVISHSDNATRVIYIDYGNSATSTEIRAIPADLTNVPPLSRKCRLVMPEGITEWSETACEEFVRLAADGATIFLLDVLTDDDTSLVKLTLNDENVTDMLAKFCQYHPPITEERLPPLGEENSPNVFITRVSSLDEFYIQAESSTTDSNMMLERLQAAPSFLPLNTFEVGTICAAKFLDDGNWYRAKILSHSGDSITVQYIDYGNTAVTNEARLLPVDIINIPALSKCCALQKPKTVSSWPPEAHKTLEELSGEGETMFQFEILDDSSEPICVKLSLNGNNVIDMLVPLPENSSSNTCITETEVDSCENVSVGEKVQSNEENETISESIMDKTKYDNEQAINNAIAKSAETLYIHKEKMEDTNIQDTENSNPNSVAKSEETSCTHEEKIEDTNTQNMDDLHSNSIEQPEETLCTREEKIEDTNIQDTDNSNFIKQSEETLCTREEKIEDTNIQDTDNSNFIKQSEETLCTREDKIEDTNTQDKENLNSNFIEQSEETVCTTHKEKMEDTNTQDTVKLHSNSTEQSEETLSTTHEDIIEDMSTQDTDNVHSNSIEKSKETLCTTHEEKMKDTNTQDTAKLHSNSTEQSEETLSTTHEDIIEDMSTQDTDNVHSNSIEKSKETLCTTHEEKMEDTNTQEADNVRSKSIVELTVDEIIQNMERNTTDKPNGEADTINISSTESLKDNDIKEITKNVENLEAENNSESCKSDYEIQEINDDADHLHAKQGCSEEEIDEQNKKIVNDEKRVSLNIQASNSVEAKNDVNDFQEREDNIINLETKYYNDDTNNTSSNLLEEMSLVKDINEKIRDHTEEYNIEGSDKVNITVTDGKTVDSKVKSLGEEESADSKSVRNTDTDCKVIDKLDAGTSRETAVSVIVNPVHEVKDILQSENTSETVE